MTNVFNREAPYPFSPFWMLVWAVAIIEDGEARARERDRKRREWLQFIRSG